VPVVGKQELLRSNAAANAGATAHAKGAVDVSELTWGQLQLPAGWEQPDIVLAADLVHDNLHITDMTTKSFLLLAGCTRYSSVANADD
jgi:Lysine methyltransferase